MSMSLDNSSPIHTIHHYQIHCSPTHFAAGKLVGLNAILSLSSVCLHATHV